MQDVHQINDGVVGGRLSLLRRLNNHPLQLQEHAGNVTYHLQQQQQPQQVALKCPRCDSLNTKFCYYNNYNLSQPRHFCKNCRRYWTKGGVLRNVPFGGGCRKSKRSSSSSKHKSSSSSNDSDSLSSRKNAQSSTHSSSESSSTPPAVSGGALFQIPEVANDFGMSSGLENNNNHNSNNNNSNLFSGDIDGIMSLITNNNNNNSENENSTSVSAAETASFTEFLQNQQAVQEEWDMGKICGVHHQEEDKIGGSIDLVMDPTVRIEDLLQNRGSNVGFTALEWHLAGGSNCNQGLYDVPDSSTVDQAGYWSQSTTAAHHIDHQWSDSTTSHLPLFLP